MNKEAFWKFIDYWCTTKNFLFIFPLKWPAIFFLRVYLVYFILFMHLTIDDLLEAGFDFYLFASYIRFAKVLLSIFSFMVLLSASTDQDETATLLALGIIFCFKCTCLYRIISTALFTTQELCILRLPYIYLEVVHDFCRFVEKKQAFMEYTPMYWYLSYIVFNLTVILGWYILIVIHSYRRNMLIPTNPAPESNATDVHIVPVAEKPADSGASSHKWKETKKKSNKGSKNKSKTKSNRKHGRRR